MLRIGTLALVGALTAWLFFACGDKGYQPYSAGTGSLDGGGSGIDGSCNSNRPVSFSLDVLPLINRACSCHVDGTTGPDLHSYPSVLSAADISNTAIQQGSMPLSGPLSSSDKALFQSWIDGGKLNN